VYGIGRVQEFGSAAYQREAAAVQMRPRRGQDAPPRASSVARGVVDTADRAAKLTGQLLAFARRQPLKPEVFVVGDRTDTLAELVRPLMGARVTIETSVECAGCAVNADPNQFETALCTPTQARRRANRLQPGQSQRLCLNQQ
jgi:C4-dicarboxylate-specific signal transduction histidine kinase